MDEKEKVLQIKEHPDFLRNAKEPGATLPSASNATNPIAKNLIKYFKSSAQKFSIKDLLR